MLYEWDRADYVVADLREIDCGFLRNEPEWDDGVFYLNCTGGASASYLYAVRSERLALDIHPEGDDGLGWLNTDWERRAVVGEPDTLVIHQNTCDPSCSEGQLVSRTLQWDQDFASWNAIECTTPDGRTMEESGWNASARPSLELSACH